MVSALLYFALAIVGTIIVWWGSGLLETASEELAVYYQLPPAVQGAIIAAIGSSFPELASVVEATLIHGTFDLGVSAIIGSAIFNILVIPGASGLVGKRLASTRDLIFKDIQFYITSVVVLMLTFALAVIYYPVPGDGMVGEVSRSLAAIPFCLYGLYVFLQHQEVRDHIGDTVPENLQPLREWGRLVAGLVAILVGVEGLLISAIELGNIFDTPNFLWGVTIVAAGTSVPDMFISVRAARKGEGEVSMANVVGSNIFDLLIAAPAGILIAGTTAVNFGVAVPMMSFLLLVTIILVVMMRHELSLNVRESASLLGLYALFVVWMVLETFEVTGIVP
jgi:cation:H+ antiporter